MGSLETFNIELSSNDLTPKGKDAKVKFLALLLILFLRRWD